MPKHILRFLVRFVIFAIIDTALVLCLIAGARLWHVRDAVIGARKYAAAEQPSQVIRALRLAYRWAPAYPAFSETVDQLYAQALRQAGTPETTPDRTRRTFTAPIPFAEKALIPADMLINLLYRAYSQGQDKSPASATTASAPSAELRPDPDELAARQAIALHTPPPAGQAQAYTRENTRPRPEPPPAAGVPPAPETAPPPQPVTTPAYNPNAMWGAVTMQDAPLYDLNGKKTRELPAGSLINVLETRNTPDGEVVLCSVWSRSGNFNDVILRRDHVELYAGYPISAASKEQRVLVSRRAEILAAIKSRQEALAQAASTRNPHQGAYRDVLRQHKAITDESQKLKDEFDNATGNRRMELANRLRTLKNEQFTLMPKYQEIKKKKEDWDRSNQNSLPDTATDPQIRQLNQQLDQIDAQLRNV